MSHVDAVKEAALDLVWSHWSVLGVPGARSGSDDVVVSPVDLVLFTPGIVGARDARLAMLAQAWCAAHGARVFGSKELAVRRQALPVPARDAFDAWTSVLRHAEGAPWPTASSASADGPPIDERDVPFRPDRRGALHLRARSLFGIGVRADLVCALLQADAARRPLRSPDVAHLGHSARAVQLALLALEAAGLVQAYAAGRTRAYSLVRPREVATILDADGLVWVDWHHAFVIAFHLVALAEHPSTGANARDVRAHTVARLLAPHVQAVHDLPVIPLRPGDDDPTERLLAWGVEALATFGRPGG